MPEAAKKGAPSGKGLSPEDIKDKKEARKKIGVITPDASGNVVLPVPWYSQAPQRGVVPGWSWGDDTMRSRPLKDVGCGVTSAAMILSYFGYDCTPRDLNEHAKTKGVYAPGKNSVADWNLLFNYRQAGLRHVRGSEENDRELTTKRQTKDAAARKVLWDLARTRAKNGLPSIARVDYDDPDTPHDDWGDHFVVVVGVHKNGNLIINDPGRFLPRNLKVGNGAQYPDLKDNQIAEDPKNGTSKNGGYRLMRIDTIDGTPAVPSTVGPLTRDNWREWATEQIEGHLESFGRKVLADARAMIASQIPRTFADGFELGFKAEWLEFLSAENLQQLIKQTIKEAFGKVVQVLTDVKNRVRGVFPAVEPPGFFGSWLRKAEAAAGSTVGKLEAGVVKLIERTSDGATLDLKALPEPPYLVELQRVANNIKNLGDLTLELRKVDIHGETYYGFRAHAKLTAGMEEDAGILAHVKSSASFLFKDPTELVEAIIVKVFTAVGLITWAGTYNEAIAGLLRPEDQDRLRRIIKGRVRFEVAGDAELLSPREVLGFMKVDQAKLEEATAVFDFDGTTVTATARGAGSLGVTIFGTKVNLAAAGNGSLQAVMSFEGLWQRPTAGFKALVDQLRARLADEGTLGVTVNGAFKNDAVQLDGDARFSLRWKRGGALAFDFGSTLSGRVHVEARGATHDLKFKLAGNAGIKFELPSAPGYETLEKFWPADATTDTLETHFRQLLGLLRAHLRELGVSVSLTASGESTRVGLALNADAGLTVALRNDQATIAFDAGAGAKITHAGNDVRLSMTARAGLSLALPLDALFEDPRQQVTAFFAAVRDAHAHAAVQITASDTATRAIVVGPFKVGAGSSGRAGLTLAYRDGGVDLDFSGSGTVDVKVDETTVKLDLDAGARARVPLDGRVFAGLWDDPEGEYASILEALPAVFESLVRSSRMALSLQAKGSATFKRGLIQLKGSNRLKLTFAQSIATARIEGSSSTFVDLSAVAGSDLPVRGNLALDLAGDAGIALDLSGVDLKRFWSEPGLAFKELLDNFPDLLHAKAYIDVKSEARSNAWNVKLGAATLSVGAGLRLECSKQAITLKFGTGARLKLDSYALFVVRSELSGEITLPTRNLRALWASPDRELRDILVEFVDENPGDLHLDFKGDAVIDDRHPLPAIQDKLDAVGLTEVMAAARIHLDFSSIPTKKVEIFFNLEGVTSWKPFGIESDLEASLSAAGMTDVEGFTIKNLIADPRGQLEEIAVQAQDGLASILTVTVSWMNIELITGTTSIEALLAAKRLYESGDHVQAYARLLQSVVRS